jgi:hypothetical protein
VTTPPATEPTDREPLVLGPLVRYVDETSASVWVETRDHVRVTVRAGDREWHARTFAVHGHHYALVEVDGLEPGSLTPYVVELDGARAWPPAEGEGADLPPSVLATLKPGKPLRMAFGSCRTSVGHDAEGYESHGIDVLRALALELATDEAARWPDLVLFLGDQVYADQTTKPMREFIAARRDIHEPPGTEVKDYEEYAYLYQLAWTDPLNRWLLSTLPSLMIFDDHDVRDDWNTSYSWRQEMEALDWWADRIVSGLASYWVYQHLGNLSPEQRAEEKLWQRVVQHEGEDEVDLTEDLRALAAQANEDPESYSWSYAREFGDVRLVVVDSRSARVLTPDRRHLLDDTETEWLDRQMRGDVRQLLVATSLPFLLPPGLHYLEAFSEAMVNRAWGRRAAYWGEKLRRAVDLEHWAAFQEAFHQVARMAVEVADGRRGSPPESVTFLSGDVHHSYLAEVRREQRGGGSRIVQAVCSPIRNPLSVKMRFATAALAYAVAGPVGELVARSAKVQNPPFSWGNLAGPWFDNSIAVLEDGPEGITFRWRKAVVVDDDHQHPQLRTLAEYCVRPR